MTSAAGSVAAVDVGGTSIKSALVAADGTVSHERRIPTPVAQGADEVVRAVRAEAARVTGLGRDTGVEAIGVVVPGSVDAAAGVARYAANLGWRDVPLAELVRADTGLRAVLEHDVRAAGVAERALGAAAGVRDCVVVVIGTGIAAIVCADGRVVRGSGGLAGELGHLPVWPDGEQCPCGQRGCLERYASAAAIGRGYLELTGRRLGAEQVAAALGSDDAADRVWTQAVDALAIALASCTMLLDPDRVVLSGGLSQAGDALLGPVRCALAERVTWRSCPELVLSPLGGRAGLLGAALLARSQSGGPGRLGSDG